MSENLLEIAGNFEYISTNLIYSWNSKLACFNDLEGYYYCINPYWVQSQWQLYSTILCFWADPLHSEHMQL